MKHATNLALILLLAACSGPPDLHRFAGTAPAFDPMAFWTGHTRSWGVVESRAGAPTETIETDCLGTPDATGLHMRQTLTEGDGTVRHRDWHLRQTGAHRYAATANDMVGEAHGEATGRVFHWTWVWATRPGQPWRNVTMDQWMYAYPDGSMVNRTTITKLGITLAQVTERFDRAP